MSYSFYFLNFKIISLSLGKQNALKLTRHSPIITRLSDQIETSNLPTIDCFLPDQDRFTQFYGSAIQSYSKCCSICQKGKLYAIELSSCKHKYYSDQILEQTFNDCCYSRLYQTKLTSSSFLQKQQQDHRLLADNKGFTTAALLTAQLTGHDHSILDLNYLDSLINSHLTKNGQTNNQINQAINNRRKFNPSSILQSTDNVQSINQANNMLSSNLNSNSNEIIQQLQLNVDIEKLYLSKAKLMLNLKRNQSLISNLNEEERNLLLKALDTSKLDFTIKHLTNLLHNGSFNLHGNNLGNTNLASNLASNLATNLGINLITDLYSNSQSNSSNLITSLNKTDLKNELRPLIYDTNLIDQLQLLLTNKLVSNTTNQYIDQSSIDHYSNLPVQDETSSSLLDDDDLDLNVEDEINIF